MDSIDISHLSLTWFLSYQLRGDVLIPLNVINCSSTKVLPYQLSNYKNGKEFVDVLNRYKSKDFKILDLNHVFNLLCGVAKIQDSLCTAFGWKQNYFFKCKISNVKGMIPFVDAKEVINHFDTFGLPMCLDSSTVLPKGFGPEKFLEIYRVSEYSSEPHLLHTSQAFVMFSLISQSLGIPNHNILTQYGNIDYIKSLFDAGIRSTASSKMPD